MDIPNRLYIPSYYRNPKANEQAQAVLEWSAALAYDYARAGRVEEAAAILTAWRLKCEAVVNGEAKLAMTYWGQLFLEAFLLLPQDLRIPGINSEVYIAEPSIVIGSQPPAGLMPPQQEFGGLPRGITLNGLRLDVDAYVPTDSSSKLYNKYAQKGDICFNDGSVTALTTANIWRCTTAGVNGSGAVWTADPH